MCYALACGIDFKLTMATNYILYSLFLMSNQPIANIKFSLYVLRFVYYNVPYSMYTMNNKLFFMYLVDVFVKIFARITKETRKM